MLLVVMFACMVMSYSLLLFNYTASVVFTSAYVLLMFHLLAPGGMRLIGERAIDTAVGCAIAIAASHLFPYWEYRLMGKLVNDMIARDAQLSRSELVVESEDEGTGGDGFCRARQRGGARA